MVLLGAGAPHIYVRAWTPCFFHSTISTQTFLRVLTASMDSCAAIRINAPSVAYVTSYGRVWRKGDGKRALECVLEEVQSVELMYLSIYSHAR